MFNKTFLNRFSGQRVYRNIVSGANRGGRSSSLPYCHCRPLNANRCMGAGICARREAGKTECLNIIACENAIRGSSQLKAEVKKYLTEADAEYMEGHVGFPDCAVDRIIPPVQDRRAADVVVEKYFEWDVEERGFRGEIPQIEGMNVVSSLEAYLERKLFTLNGPNAVTACYGYLKGYKTINDALTDGEIYNEVLGMMEECGAMLEKRHGFSSQQMAEYRQSLMKRFVNPYIIDNVTRVAREPIRKLSANDRITAPMQYAQAFGIKTPHYYTGVAAVLLYDNPDDEQSRQMQELIAALGVRAAYEKISGVAAASASSAEIEKEYDRLRRQYR